jgi:hypothetical protein
VVHIVSQFGAAAHLGSRPALTTARRCYTPVAIAIRRKEDMPSPIEVLQKAREQMVKARRDVAEVLARPYDPRTTPDARTSFMQIQATIDHIDKAIVDEKD